MRNMKRILNSTIAASILTALAVLPAAAQTDALRGRIEPKLVPVPVQQTASRIDVWTNAGDGAVLNPGQSVNVFFRTDRDAYVAVVDIDTQGRARLLFPESPYDDGFVQSRRTVSIPSRGAGYRLMVTGPAGVERIVAFASDRPLTHAWRSLIDDDGGSITGAILDGFTPDRGSSWNASVTLHTANARVVLAGGSDRGTLQPRLVPMPVNDCGVSRDETWFRVGRAFGRRRY